MPDNFVPRTLRRYPTAASGGAGGDDGGRDGGGQQCRRFFALVLERLAVNQFVYLLEWCLRWALLTLGVICVLYFLFNGGAVAILDWLIPAPRPTTRNGPTITELPDDAQVCCHLPAIIQTVELRTAVIDHRHHTVTVYDSLGAKSNFSTAEADVVPAIEFLLNIVQERSHLAVPLTTYNVLVDWDTPQQGNAHDCGVYTMLFMALAVADKPISGQFTRLMHMQHWRQLLVFCAFCGQNRMELLNFLD